MGYWPAAAPPPVRSTYASRPVAGQSGRLWLPTDSIFSAYDDGSDWQEYVAGMPVSDSGWPTTWVNQGTATSDQTKGGLLIAQASPTAADNCRILKKAAPATPWVVTIACLGEFFAGSNQGLALVGRASGSGSFVVVAESYSGGTLISADKWTSPTAFSSSYGSAQVTVPGPLIWLRLEDDGTNRNSYVSPDGQYWQRIHQVARTDFITVDEVGVALFPNKSSAGFAAESIHAWFVSWSGA